MAFSSRIAAAALAAASLASHAQPVDRTGRPAPTPQRIKLGGTVEFGADNLLRVAPAERAPACHSAPFTADEVERIARGQVSDFRVMQPDGRPGRVTRMVNLPARGGRPARQVPVSEYVRELNLTETFFNQHGLTLRHGALALPPQTAPVPGQRLVACRSRDDLPGVAASQALIRYQLVDALPRKGHLNMGEKGNAPGGREPQTTPNPRGPGDVMGLQKARLGTPVINPGSLTREGLARARQWQVPVGLPQLPEGPLQTVQSGSACPKTCPYDFGTTARLSNEGQLLVDHPDEVVFTQYTCDIATSSGNNAKDCPMPELLKPVVRKVTRRQHWEELGIDVEYFRAHYDKVCDTIEHAFGANPYYKSWYVSSWGAQLYQFSGSSQGTETVTIGPKAGNFFDGVLKYSNQGVGDCVVEVGSTNSLFGARFCLRYDTLNTYAPKEGFHVVNGAGIDTGVTLFGENFRLIEGRAQADWTQPVPGAAQAPVPSSTMPVETKTLFFQGPQAVFALGPVPLSVNSYADATLSAGAPVLSFTPPPLVPNVAGTGRVGMDAGGVIDASVHMEAAIDAYILAAGISGSLTVLRNTATGGITSNINPAANELTVDKAYKLTSTALAGRITAFVEVDLFVYTERYEIELVSFPGVTHTEPLQTETWGPASAVIPSTATTAPACSN